jgi:3-hydroxybutyryl-CoA dehydrogenase
MTGALDSRSVVAVIGSGAMGSGIAQVAAAAGYTVKLFDTRADGVSGKAIADIGKMYGKLVEKGKMSGLEADTAVRACKPPPACRRGRRRAGHRSHRRDLDVKRMLFADLEGIVGDDCILATNTSSISVTAIAASCAGRSAGRHALL